MVLPTLPNDIGALNPEALKDRSRRLCAVANRHCAAVAPFTSRDKVREHARRLGLFRQGVIVGNEHQRALVIELAVWTASGSSSTALQRYARQVQLVPDSDEAIVLAGMLDSVLSFWQAERRHPVAGWELRDLSWGQSVWVVDERIDQCLSQHPSSLFVTRLFGSAPDGFAMSCSSILPAPSELGQIAAAKVRDAEGVPDPEESVRASRTSVFGTAIYTALLRCGATGSTDNLVGKAAWRH